MNFKGLHLRGIKGLLGLFLLVSPLCAIEQVIGPFSGLNNEDNSAIIPADKAQDLLNVDLSLGGKSVKKRDGYGLSYALTITTSPVHGVYDFYDNSGNDIALAFNDAYMTASINGAAATVLFSTGPNGATYQCVDSQGFAYCANTNRSAIIKTNGLTTGTAPLVVVTTGTMVAVTPDRLVLAGFSAVPNRIDFSAANDFTSWTTGVSNTSAFQFTITAPGSKVTHITYAFNRIMWFKDSSFGYILPGATPVDWVIKTISPNLGTLDNSSVYYQGILYFRGNDGHIWSYDGSNLTKMSRDIGGTISASQSRASNSWTQTTSADFGDGTFFPSIYADTITTSGSLQLTFPDNFNSFRDGTNNTKNIWKTYSPTDISSTISTNAVVSNGNLVMFSTNAYETFVRTQNPFTDYRGGTTFYVLLSSITPAAGSGGESRYTIYLSSFTDDTKSPFNLNDYFYASFNSSNTGKISLKYMKSSADTSICSFCQSFESTMPAKIEIFLSTSNYNISINDRSVKSGSMLYSPSQSYLHIGSYWSRIPPTIGYTYTDAFGIAPETTTFYSPVKNAPSLTSWDSFSASYQNNAGGNSFFIRSSTNNIQVNSSTPSWTAITSGNNPTISTGTYFQFKNNFSLLVSSGPSPKLDDFTQYWFEGQALDKSYGTYFRDAIWWSVAAGTGATTNNRILKLDLINQTWLLYDLTANGFFTRQNNLYFGSALSGNVFKYGSATSDNGSAINAYWKSKDFFLSSPFTDDDVTSLSFFFQSVNSSSMTVTHTINGTTETSYTIPLQRNVSSGRNNRSLPQGTTGNTFSVKFGNNAADQNFEVFAIGFDITPKSWTPNSQ